MPASTGNTWSYVPSVKMQTSLFVARDHCCFQMLSSANMRLLYTPENTEHRTHWIPKSFYTHFTWLCCSLSKTLNKQMHTTHTHISIIHKSVSSLSMQQSLPIEATQLSSTSISYSLQSCGFLLFSMVLFKVVNKTRNGMEWNGMEKVNKTWHGTAESAQSTPMHPWVTELHHAICSCTHVRREASG